MNFKVALIVKFLYIFWAKFLIYNVTKAKKYIFLLKLYTLIALLNIYISKQNNKLLKEVQVPTNSTWVNVMSFYISTLFLM